MVGLTVASGTGAPTALIERAISSARMGGYKIGPVLIADLRIIGGKWAGPHHGPVCPITAVLLGSIASVERPTLQGMFDDASRILGVPGAWVDEFISGFWDAEDPCGLFDDAWFLGRSFRLRFVEAEDVLN